MLRRLNRNNGGLFLFLLKSWLAILASSPLISWICRLTPLPTLSFLLSLLNLLVHTLERILFRYLALLCNWWFSTLLWSFFLNLLLASSWLLPNRDWAFLRWRIRYYSCWLSLRLWLLGWHLLLTSGEMMSGRLYSLIPVLNVGKVTNILLICISYCSAFIILKSLSVPESVDSVIS